MTRISLLLTTAMLMLSGLFLRGETREGNDVTERVGYRQGWAVFGLRDDEPRRLRDFVRQYRELGQGDTITIIASASPEGTPQMLTPLARKRGTHLLKALREAGLPDSLLVVGVCDVDYALLLDSVRSHPSMPLQAQVIEVLQDTVSPPLVVRGRLLSLGGGKAWRYMYSRFFPSMRYARATFPHMRPHLPLSPRAMEPAEALIDIEQPEALPALTSAPSPLFPRVRKPRYWALKSNMLHDVLLVPNIGLEIYIGKQWSLSADYSGAWWGYKYRTKLWRYYGGNIELRRYLQAHLKPLTGWHAGVYGQLASYDFQLGNDGYQSKFSWGAGVLLGYMLPIGRHFNIDFALGLGYFGGKYKKCHYGKYGGYWHDEWTGTYYRHLWGPTRGEITLTWLLGHGNVNNKKGGAK